MGLHNPRNSDISGSIWLEGKDLIQAKPEEVRALRGPADGDDLPGPAVGDAPVLHGRQPDRGGLPRPQQRQQVGGEEARRRDARPRRHPAGEQAGRRLPAPVLRRHAATRHDRDGAGVQPGADHRRRAHHGARRHRPGADPGADEEPPAGVQLGDHPDHARPRGRRRDLRRRGGHVRRPVRRAGQRAGHLLPTRDALHVGPAHVHAAHGPHPSGPVAAHRRPAAVADPGAQGLRVQPALHLPGPRRGRPLHDRAAGAGCARPRTGTSRAATSTPPPARRSGPRRSGRACDLTAQIRTRLRPRQGRHRRVAVGA